MGRKLFTFVGTFVFLTTTFTATSGTGEVIDRIVATVNGHIILLSDWEDSLRYEAFSSGRPLDRMTADDRKSALDHLIDQELLREQLKDSDVLHPSSEDVAQRVVEIRKQYPEAETELGWRRLIDSHRLSEDYREELLPQLRQSGAQNVPLAEVTAKIKELLTQKKISQLLTAWLQDLRAGSEIRAEALAAGSGGRSQ